jgi:hypothetical protein
MAALGWAREAFGNNLVWGIEIAEIYRGGWSVSC